MPAVTSHVPDASGSSVAHTISAAPGVVVVVVVPGTDVVVVVVASPAHEPSCVGFATLKSFAPLLATAPLVKATL